MIIEAKNLQKRFGPIVALDDVNIKVPKGLTLLLGPNGGGKSTFMKLALGLYRPTKGEIKLLGRNPWKDANVRKNVGASFDPPALPKFVSGREWLSFLAEGKGVDAEEEIAKVSEMFNLGAFLNRRIDRYSSGMLKRLSIAQAFIGDPKVIFLDEPLANIDFDSVAQIVSVIAQEKEKGTSFVVISHIWEPLLPLADYAVVLSAGRVYLAGRAEDVKEGLENLFRSDKLSHQHTRVTNEEKQDKEPSASNESLFNKVPRRKGEKSRV